MVDIFKPLHFSSKKVTNGCCHHNYSMPKLPAWKKCDRGFATRRKLNANTKKNSFVHLHWHFIKEREKQIKQKFSLELDLALVFWKFLENESSFDPSCQVIQVHNCWNTSADCWNTTEDQTSYFRKVDPLPPSPSKTFAPNKMEISLHYLFVTLHVNNLHCTSRFDCLRSSVNIFI